MIGDLAGKDYNDGKYNYESITFEVYLLNGLSNALLFALEIGDRGVLELKPVLLVSLQCQSLWPEIYSHMAELHQNVNKCELQIQFLFLFFRKPVLSEISAT